jgi:hypothetical protein
MVFCPAVGNSQTDTFAGKAAEFRYHTHRKITNRHYPFSTVAGMHTPQTGSFVEGFNFQTIAR